MEAIQKEVVPVDYVQVLVFVIVVRSGVMPEPEIAVEMVTPTQLAKLEDVKLKHETGMPFIC